MATTSIRFDSASLAWRGFWRKLSAPRRSDACIHLRGAWRHLRLPSPAVWFAGRRYCLRQCLEHALAETLRGTRSAPKLAAFSHRVPLGLFLISRQQLTAEQLQTAVTAQRAAGHGRIGDWLQALGFVTEQQVTAALAWQWACPVLRPSFFPFDPRRAPQIPVSLLESFGMVPVAYAESPATLHIAFGERVDYTALYAIEQMLGCHTEPCLVVPSFVRACLDTLSTQRGDTEIVFESLPDRSEFSRIIRSYCVRLTASEVRLVPCGPHTWARLWRASHPPLDLVLRSRQIQAASAIAWRSSVPTLSIH